MKYMKLALEAAKEAVKEGNVPVGCAIIKNNEVLSIAYNKKNSHNISVYHAEILAIIEACNKLNTWNLEECDMYVTLKPCAMCAGAIAESRIKNVYYLLDSNYHLNNVLLKTNYIKIDFESEYPKLISDFFVNVRNKKL